MRNAEVKEGQTKMCFCFSERKWTWSDSPADSGWIPIDILSVLPT